MASYNSKSVRLTETLAEDVRRGRFHAADPLPGENHLATVYGVSRSTIRRALAELVKQGLLLHAPNRGVCPAPGAVSAAAPPIPAVAPSSVEETRPRPSRPLRFGVAWAGPPDALGIAITNGIRGYCTERSIDLGFFGSGSGHAEALRVLAEPREYGLDALICWPFEMPGYRACFEQLAAERFPLVFLDRPMDGIEVTTVESDNSAGMYEATMCLILEHHAPVRYFGTYSASVRTLRMRYEGYLRAMQDAGFSPEPPIFTPLLEGDPAHWALDRNYRDPARVIGKFLDDGVEFPLNLVCVNSYLARGVYVACAERRLRIGPDVRVIAFDDLPLARLLDPPLSVVRQPGERIGMEAARLLERNCGANPPKPAVFTLPVELVLRASHLAGAEAQVVKERKVGT